MKSDSAQPARCPRPRLMRTVLLSLAWLPSLILPLHARPVKCRAVCMEGATPPAALTNVGDEGVDVTCTVPANTLSAQTTLFAKDNVIQFLSTKDRKLVATATIPATVNAALLLFIPTAQPPARLPWRIFVIEDSHKNFPDGGAFVANFYDKDIRFVIGEHKIMLRPTASHGFERPAKRDDFNMAQVAFEFQQGEDWRSVSESLLRFLPDMRYLICAYVDPASGRPRLFICTDLKPAPIPKPRK